MTELRQARVFAASSVAVYVIVVALAWDRSSPPPPPAGRPAPTTVFVVPSFAELDQIGVVYHFIVWLLEPLAWVSKPVVDAARAWMGLLAAAPDC